MEISLKPESNNNTTLIPTFLLKLVNLLEQDEFKEFIAWSDDGTYFVVHDQSSFSKQVLPKFFKHNRFSSFVRQLNMYGFRKVPLLTSGVMLIAQESIGFHHPFFIRGELNLLQHIKRKVTQPAKFQQDELVQIIEDVQQVKSSQSDINSSLSELKRENEDLWREVVSLRQKHSQQQKVVNRLIQFLVTLVQCNGMGMKRQLPLMIDDGSGSSLENSNTPPFKRQKTMSSDSLDTNQLIASSPLNPSTSAALDSSSSAKAGPLITELLSNASFKKPVEDSGFITLSGKDDLTDIVQLVKKPDQLTPMASTSSVARRSRNTSGKTQKLAHNSEASNNEVGDNSLDKFIESLMRSNSNSGKSDASVPEVSSKEQPSSSQIKPSKPTTDTGNASNKIVALPLYDSLNTNVKSVENSLGRIQRQLSNKQQVFLDYDLLQELFNSSVDIVPAPNMLDSESPLSFSASHSSNGKEVVQYDPNSFLNTSGSTDIGTTTTTDAGDNTNDVDPDDESDLLKLLG